MEQVVRAALMGVPATSQLEKELETTGTLAAESSEIKGGSVVSRIEEDRNEADDVIYDDENLKDFLVELDDESEADFDDYDMPAADY